MIARTREVGEGLEVFLEERSWRRDFEGGGGGGVRVAWGERGERGKSNEAGINTGLE